VGLEDGVDTHVADEEREDGHLCRDLKCGLRGVADWFAVPYQSGVQSD
jgi:hypothetical protein